VGSVGGWGKLSSIEEGGNFTLRKLRPRKRRAGEVKQNGGKIKGLP